MRALATVSLVCLALAAGCADKGTYVLLTFSNGPAQTVSISSTLTLDGNPTPATVTYNAKTGTMFAFPKTASIEIGSGSGQLVVVADALDANNKVLGTAMGAVTITRGKTANLTLDLTGAPDQGDLGPSGTLAIAPMNYDFGSATANTMGAVKRFTVTNTGMVATGALQVLDDGMDAADYAIVQPVDCIGRMLDPNGTCTVDVQFFPKTAGAVKNAKLHALAPSGTPGGTATAQLIGKAVPKGNLSFNETMHVFPDTAIGSDSSDTTFTLKNTGLMASTTITISRTGSDKDQFVIATDNCTGSSLSANGSCDVKVHASPTARGAIAATLSADSAPAGPVAGDTALVALSGKGLAQAQLTIINPYSVAAPFDLGTVDVGATGGSGMGNTYTFMIRNDGDLPTGQLTVDTNPMMADITALMPGTTCMSANSMGGIGTVLNAGDSCTAVIALKPTSFGKKDVTLAATATPGGAASTHVTGIGHDQITLNVSSNTSDGSKGSISDTAMPHNFNCDVNNAGMCSKVFDRTTAAIPVTITATPDAATYAQFSNWTVTGPASGLTCNPTNTATPCSITFDSSTPGGTYNLAATFKKQRFTITYVRKDIELATPSIGSLGALTSSNGFNCPAGPCVTSTESIPGGTSLTVNALPATFAGGVTQRQILGPCTAFTHLNATASCGFTVTADATVTVTFNAHNYVFVSSTVFNNGNLGGVAGASASCQADATAAHLPGTYNAWLSTTGSDAIGQLGTNEGWVRVDGKPAFRFRGDISTNHGVLYPPNLDPNGVAHAGDIVYTATENTGLKSLVTSLGPCDDWTKAAPFGTSNVAWGTLTSGNSGWTHRGFNTIAGCNGVAFRIYCFGVSNTYAIDKVGPPGGTRVAFLSTTLFTPSAGKTLTDLDNLCKGDATAQFPARNFLAFAAAPPNNTAASRFNGALGPWVRPDGVLLTQNAAGLLTANPPFLAAWDMLADGTFFSAGDLGTWTGAPNPTAAPMGNDTCTGWSSTLNMGKGGLISDLLSTFYQGVDTGCSIGHHLLCLEP